ncbi:hypothetical protein [Streptococcus pneumoniae]|jgi:hypothetical protein|uniref:Uncharacterized protein n=1 Tax=Streptococcus mitis 18/56 TaxID=1340485 RepID=S7XM19_STRMT|nr:hypothetical protein [Streptococcus pneumoniae]EPR95322.1 hypothetical protein M059_05355 [Streptococcus mitis 18/56]MDS2604575.1 hypothetical protein [Streptococcus pneumoniae]MDS3247966.1 hypothetical protein [Streptococcus pneumoniae]MDS3289079.1 hypothetical protein [Streptococcus pneumoniae]MDS3522765.1 hypothetical protein [Streptococcus pneumoniae]
MEHQEVIDWLRYCDENNIKPWEWDFKNCYSDTLTPDSITNFLKYKNAELTNPTTFRVTKLIGKYADSDKEAFYLYKLLGWQESQDSIIRGETINSYLTTFTKAIMKSSNRDQVYKEIGINPKKYLNEQYTILYYHENYQKFDIIAKNTDNFGRFAELTHTIGNFTVLPNWMNCGRGMCLYDYWDITLMSLQEFLNILSPEAWPNFIKKYYLQPYVNTDYNVELFWDNHDNNLLPKETDFPIFLKKVNERIEERGKFIIKQICDQLDQKDFNFYKEIENMDTIKFSNEF